MTITIELSDDHAAALEAQAADEGLALAIWLQRVAESFALSRPAPPAEQALRRPIWESIAERMKCVPVEVFERLPTDGASEHDHYLYGTPKRNQ